MNRDIEDLERELAALTGEAEPEPMDAADVGDGQVPCSACGGRGGFAGGLKCRTCRGEGHHELTLPAKWIYTERRRWH